MSARLFDLMPYCASCGKEVSPQDRFCPSCGVGQGVQALSSGPTPQEWTKVISLRPRERIEERTTEIVSADESSSDTEYAEEHEEYDIGKPVYILATDQRFLFDMLASVFSAKWKISLDLSLKQISEVRDLGSNNHRPSVD